MLMVLLGNGEAYGRKYIQGDHIGVLVDLNRNIIIFYLNGISQGILSIPHDAKHP